MKVLAFMVVFMFAALTTRLWFLQVLASQQFSSLANDNQVRIVPITPVRGLILDRSGNVLVGNRPSTVVTIDRLAMNGHDEEVLYRLTRLLHLPEQNLADRLNSIKYLPYQPVPVAEDVPKQAIFYIREHQNLFPGVGYELAAVRDYPQGTLAAHILGSLGEISPEQLKLPAFDGYVQGDVVGKSGIESTYEPWLHGTNGVRVIQVNAQGRVLNDDFGRQPPKTGQNVVLSIDDGVQQLAERSLDLGIRLARQTPDRNSGMLLRAPGGAVVVMDPRNGQVLALASSPTFDPSVFVGGISQSEFAAFSDPQAHQPLFDRAVQGLYPAGSTFKPFVAMAALRENFANPNGNYACPAEYTAPGDTSGTVFHNWDPVNRGYIDLPTALAVSCDTVFYQFGWDFWVRYWDHGKRDLPVMERDLSKMGFGRPTGIDLSGQVPGTSAERVGVVPSAQYKEQLIKDHPELFRPDERQWLPGDYINLSIGQGFLQVTPLQMAVAYSAIANGGTLWRPHVGLRIETPDGKIDKRVAPTRIGRVPLSKKQVLFIRDALVGVTTHGTASAAFAGFPLNEYPVAGKTGTADIKPFQPYSWFAAMAPANNPRYVVVALVEQGGHGATTAAPVVRRILQGLFHLPVPKELQAGTVQD